MAKNNFKLNKTNHQHRVLIAMSGGVDSSVSAMLLKKSGYDVVGIFFRFGHPPTLPPPPVGGGEGGGESEALGRARQVANKLKIPFYVVNKELEFKKRVKDYFLEALKRGETPNPCVVCNKLVKFNFLLKYAEKLGADYVATGHYARLANGKQCVIARSRGFGAVAISGEGIAEPVPSLSEIAAVAALPRNDRRGISDASLPAGRQARNDNKGIHAVRNDNGGAIEIIFSSPVRAVTPGQSIVFYDGERLVGGGIIA